MGYTNVVIVDRVEEETKNFGRRAEFSALENLYEVNTLATVGNDQSNVENESPENSLPTPNVLSSTNCSYLCIAIESDISIFKFDYELTYNFSHTLTGCVAKVVKWMGNNQYLALFTSDYQFFIISADFGVPIFALNISGSSGVCKQATLQVHEQGEECLVVISASGVGTSNTIIKFPKWKVLLDATADQLQNNMAEFFSNVDVQSDHTGPFLSQLTIVNNGLSIMGVRSDSSDVFMTPSNTVDYTNFMKLAKDTSIIQQQETCNGHYLVQLFSNGDLVLRDLWTQYVVAKKSVITSKDESDSSLYGFLLIEQSEIEFSHSLIALIIQSSKGTNLEVRSLKTLEPTYSLAVREGTVALPVFQSTNYERVMLLIEPFALDQRSISLNNTKIREISEAQPEKRLARLISRGQLDEAEKFAVQFGLDVQKVHVSRMEQLLDESVMHGADVFSSLIKSMDSVEDHNLVGEHCYSAASTFKVYDHIISILDYAKKRAITDVETASRLDSIAYVLATYRMVMGIETADFSEDSLWSRFVEGTGGSGDWFSIFLDFISCGMIQEARIIWRRHGKTITDELFFVTNEGEFPQVEDVMNAIQKIVNERLDVWRDLIEFLEFDFLPQGLGVCLYSILPTLVDTLLRLVEFLENYIPQGFPDNALHVASLLERVIQRLTVNEFTPAKQAELAMIGIGLQEGKYPELTECASNLRAIKRLREVYQCYLSYSLYCSLTPETICYRILAKAIENPNLLSVNVAKFARPYMDEFRLNPDQTLYRYIEDVSTHSKGVVSASNPWDEQCLLVSHTIEKFPLKCRAITMIARGAFPPWSKKLKEAVHSMLENPLTDPQMVQELKNECQRAELGMILNSYGVQIALMTSILSSEYTIGKFLWYVFQGRERHPDDMKRLSDALKVVDIYSSLNECPPRSINSIYVYVRFAQYLQRYQDDKCVINFIENMEEDKHKVTKNEVVENLVEALYCEIDDPVVCKDQITIDERVDKMNLVQSLILRYKLNDEYYDELNKKVGCLFKLQTKYNIWAVFGSLCHSDWKRIMVEQFVQQQERNLAEIYAFSSCLSLSRDEACQIAMSIAAESKNFNGLICIMREAMLAVAKPSVEMAELTVKCCIFVLQNLPEVCPQDADPQAIDMAVDLAIQTRMVLSDLYNCTEHSMELLRNVITMSTFLDLFVMTIDQCWIEERATKSSSSDVSCSERVTGMSKRIGVYLLSNDGPLLEKLAAVPLMCAVAPSVVAVTEDMTNSVVENYKNTVMNQWDELFTFLSLQNQDLLEFFFRVFSVSLEPCVDMRHALSSNLRNISRNVCERILQMHPCDLWGVSALISSLSPSDTHMLVLELRKWVTTRKSPQTMINVLRVMQFIAINSETRDVYNALTDSFKKSLWGKRLGKLGVFINVGRDPIDVVLQKYASKQVDPDLVSKYVHEFCGESKVNEELLNYAVALILQSSEETDKEKAISLRQCADEAIRLSTMPKHDALDRLRNLIYVLCPYNYEVLHFVISRMSNMVDPGDQHVVFVDGCQRILEFLVDTPRQNTACKAEVKWFMNHSKIIQKANREFEISSGREKKVVASYETMVRQCYEESSGILDASSLLLAQEDAIQYEREDILISTLPQLAVKRLPFHPFLLHGREDIDKYLFPIIETEMSVLTVTVWQTVVRLVKWLKASKSLPRSLLLSSAVVKMSKQCTDKGDDLSQEELHFINNLLVGSERDTVVTCISKCFKKIPLSQTKIDLLQLGVDVAKGWLANTNIIPPIVEIERNEMEIHIRRLTETVYKYKTELLLKQSGLYDSKTAELVENVPELINHLYSDAIDWADDNDIKFKTGLIDELATVNNSVDLLSLQSDLIVNWIPEDGVSSSGFAVDLNDTMGGMSAPSTMANGPSLDENDIYFLPFFDNTITRVVHLINLIREKNPEHARFIMTKLMSNYKRKKMDISTISGGFKTLIRVTCVLLRSFTNEELESAKTSRDKLYMDIERLHCGRLLELAREDMTVDALYKQDMHLLVKSYILPSKRQSPQLWHLAACLIVDHDVLDKTLVDTLLNKLYSSRKKQAMLSLLRYCRQQPKLYGVKNLALFWARAADQMIADLDTKNAAHTELLRDSILFAISCPVEGGRPFDSTRSSLKALGCTMAAQLINVVRSFSTKLETHHNEIHPTELNLRWVEVRKNLMESHEQMSY
ncbi:unnamed protein product [Auanema sp. JU1783]|nr:unnamed protein product [Auanema sp. JU1783]